MKIVPHSLNKKAIHQAIFKTLKAIHHPINHIFNKFHKAIFKTYN